MLTRRYLEQRFQDDGDVSISQNPARALLLFGEQPTAAGVSVTPTNAEGIDTVYACVGILSDTLAGQPLEVLKILKGGGYQPDTDSELYTLLRDLPNPEMTSFDLRVTMARWLFLYGDAYAEIVRRPNGDIKAIWPLRSDQMEVCRNRNTLQIEYRYRHPDGSTQTWKFNAATPPIWHWRINSMDGIHGRSPIRVTRESLGAVKATQQYGARYFANGGKPGGVLSFPNKLNADSAQRMSERWRETHGSNEHSHKVVVLEEGGTFTPITAPPEDSQFIETQAKGIESVARIFRVPPFMVGATEKSTSWGTGIEEQKLGFVGFTMKPLFEQVEQSGKRDLLNIKTFATRKLRHDLDDLERGAMGSRYEAHERGFNRWLTVNDIRRAEHMNPLPDGDTMPTAQVTAPDPVTKEPRQP